MQQGGIQQPPNKLPTYPVIPNGTTTPQCKELQANNLTVCKAWATYKLVLAITRNAKLMPPVPPQ